jgi:hypothetical protein
VCDCIGECVLGKASSQAFITFQIPCRYIPLNVGLMERAPPSTMKQNEMFSCRFSYRKFDSAIRAVLLESSTCTGDLTKTHMIVQTMPAAS